MFFIIIAVLIVAALILFLVAVKIKFEAAFNNNRLKLRAVVLGIPVFAKEFVFRRDPKSVLSLYAMQKDGEKVFTSLVDLIKTSTKKEKKKNNTKQALSYIHFKAVYDIRIEFEVGASDAFLTAMASGLLNTVVGTLYATRKNKNMRVKWNVNPQFKKQILSFRANCIIKLSPANIMIGYMIYKKILRR